MTYHKIMSDLFNRYLFEPWDKATQQAMERDFRAACPGPYFLAWRSELDDDHMPRYNLIFADPRDATAWYLRWT
jgi:hypothetical protein